MVNARQHVPFFKMKQTTKDNLIYLGVAGGIVAGLIVYIFFTDRTLGRIPEIPGPILWGILSTPAIVSLILERYWKHRRRRSLWIISGAAGLANIAAMLIAFVLGWSPPVLVWSAATFLFLMAAFFVADQILVGSRRG